MLEELKQKVLEANLLLPQHGLVTFTWGNVSEIDREKEIVAIKPSGVEYSKMTAEDIVLIDLEGNILEGELRPSSDVDTHLEFYRNWPGIGGVVHTHSTWATGFAQAGKDIIPLGTTQADYFHGAVPCTRLMTEEEITLALFLYPVGNALFTLISGFVSDKFGRKVTIVAMSCSALTCYLLFIFSGMFKWTPYLTGFAIGGFMGSYWGAGDTIGGIMFSESTPTNLRSSVTVINTLLNGVMGGLATVITMILLPIIPERMFGYMYLGLTVPGLVGAIVIMWLFVGETRGLDLKTVTGTEWDKPKKVKEEQQDGE